MVALINQDEIIYKEATFAHWYQYKSIAAVLFPSFWNFTFWYIFFTALSWFFLFITQEDNNQDKAVPL